MATRMLTIQSCPLTALMLVTLMLPWAACAPPALVRDGRPESVIVISATASEDEKLAAQELQTYVTKISGATLPIVAESPARDQAQIRIGVVKTSAVTEWTGVTPASDGFVLETKGNRLFIVGGDSRGALYGVYDLIEKDLGVRWFMPGDLGEDVPSNRTIPWPDVRRGEAPAFGAVGGFSWSTNQAAAAWERRIRARVGSKTAFFGHNWSRIIPPTAENKRDHPEWFALSQGVRTNQLCSAHPDVVRITVEKAREYFDRNPTATLFSISPNDGYGFCEDWRCQAVDRLYGVTDGSLTDRFVHYANEVLQELGKTHPGRQVGMLAYVAHTRPPIAAVPHPDYVTLITHMPWEFCHVHPIDDPSCELNQRFLEYVRGWTQAARHVGVYDYYGHFYVFAPWPIVHSIRRDLPLLHDLGVERFMSETQPNWANQGLNFYVAAKLTWNPQLDVALLLDEYYTRFYGPAALPMRRYWERWEQAMIDTAKDGDGNYAWLRMFTLELVAECDALLTEAERLASNGGEKVQRRVAFARSGFRFTEAWTRMRLHADRREWGSAIAAGEEAIQRIRDTAGTEPMAFQTTLAIQQMEAMMQPYREALAAGR